MKVVLASRNAPDGSYYRSLTVGRTYEVLGIEGDLYRLLNDRDEPIFEPECFKVIDAVEPSHWISAIVDGAALVAAFRSHDHAAYRSNDRNWVILAWGLSRSQPRRLPACSDFGGFRCAKVQSAGASR